MTSQQQELDGKDAVEGRPLSTSLQLNALPSEILTSIIGWVGPTCNGTSYSSVSIRRAGQAQLLPLCFVNKKISILAHEALYRDVYLCTEEQYDHFGESALLLYGSSTERVVAIELTEERFRNLHNYLILCLNLAQLMLGFWQDIPDTALTSAMSYDSVHRLAIQGFHGARISTRVLAFFPALQNLTIYQSSSLAFSDAHAFLRWLPSSLTIHTAKHDLLLPYILAVNEASLSEAWPVKWQTLRLYNTIDQDDIAATSLICPSVESLSVEGIGHVLANDETVESSILEYFERVLPDLRKFQFLTDLNIVHANITAPFELALPSLRRVSLRDVGIQLYDLACFLKGGQLQHLRHEEPFWYARFPCPSTQRSPRDIINFPPGYSRLSAAERIEVCQRIFRQAAEVVIAHFAAKGASAFIGELSISSMFEELWK